MDMVEYKEELRAGLTTEVIEEKRENILFYDIETTGLSRETDTVYLIGTVSWNGSAWEYQAHMTDSSDEEPVLLKTFSDMIRRYPVIIQYNGNTFDRPFLLKRCENSGIDFPEDHNETDLYRELMPLKSLLSLSSMKQKNLEERMGIKRSCPDGRDCIRLFRAWQKDKDPIKKKMLIGHNKEDLSGLLSIMSYTSYLQLYRGDYNCAKAKKEGQTLVLTLTLKKELPSAFSYSNEKVKIQGEDTSAEVTIPLKNDRIRQYYPDYKNYEYLINEDTVIPKTLGAFVDRTLKRKATPDTCYTWYTLTEDFLNTPTLQEKYLRQSLPLLLAGPKH